jgi:hypothetical protein
VAVALAASVALLAACGSSGATGSTTAVPTASVVPATASAASTTTAVAGAGTTAPSTTSAPATATPAAPAATVVPYATACAGVTSGLVAAYAQTAGWVTAEGAQVRVNLTPAGFQAVQAALRQAVQSSQALVPAADPLAPALAKVEAATAKDLVAESAGGDASPAFLQGVYNWLNDVDDAVDALVDGCGAVGVDVAPPLLSVPH